MRRIILFYFFILFSINWHLCYRYVILLIVINVCLCYWMPRLQSSFYQVEYEEGKKMENECKIVSVLIYIWIEIQIRMKLASFTLAFYIVLGIVLFMFVCQHNDTLVLESVWKSTNVLYFFCDFLRHHVCCFFVCFYCHFCCRSLGSL